VTRYRLRFLLQEVDLNPGETVIGRSSSCQITLDDPLVSRRHAIIRVDDGVPTIEDLGSRNGSYVGAQAVEGKVSLSDGDRIRIGALEMVFCLASESGRPRAQAHRVTGFLCRCEGCGQPYPVELPHCPGCGSDRRADEQTLSGARRVPGAWTLELSVEVLKKAIQLGRWDDADRMLVRLKSSLEEQIASADKVDRQSLDQAADAIAELCEGQRTAAWGRWILSLYAVLGFLPPASVPRRLSLLPESERNTLLPAAERVLKTVRDPASLTELETAALESLQNLRRSVDPGAS
jgi:predicted component of type VI protein secretion system